MIKIFTKSFNQSGFIYLLIFVLFSCSKKDSDSNPTTEIVELSISQTEASPYQFIKLELPSSSKPININAKSIQLNIGGISVEAYADSSAFAQNRYSYYLLIPELSIGDKTISIKIADAKTAEAKIKINGFNKITDIPVYIKNRQTSAQNEIAHAAHEYDLRVQAGQLRSSTADSLKLFMQQAYDMNKDLVNLLSESEKRTYVQLLDANKQIISDLKSVFTDVPLFNHRMATPGDCESKKSDAEIYRLNGFTETADRLELEYKQCYANSDEARLEGINQANSKTKNAIEAAKAAKSANPGLISGSWAFVSTFVSEICKEAWEAQIGSKSLEEAFGVKETEDGKQDRIATQEFVIGQNYGYSAGIQLVNLNRQDQNISGFNKLIQAIDYFNEVMDFFSQFLPSVPEIKVLARKTNKIYVDGFTIDQISDPRIAIEISVGGKGNLIKVKANTTDITQNINFNFRLNFSSSYGSGSKIINATAIAPDSAAIYRKHLEGNWKVDIFYASNNQPVYTDYVTINSTGYYVYMNVTPTGVVSNSNPPRGPYSASVTGNASIGYRFYHEGQVSDRLSYPVNQMVAVSSSYKHYFTRQ